MKIYGLFNTHYPQEICYVGSTSKKLKSRLNGHLNKPVSLTMSEWITEIGRENVGIVLLENCDFDERVEREQHHIEKYENLLNSVRPSNNASDFFQTILPRHSYKYWIDSEYKRLTSARNC